MSYNHEMRHSYTPSIPELRAFIACAQHGTTTMAASNLNLTQSAISRSVASLEQRLGVILFERVRKRLILSPAGHAFLPKAQSILDSLDDAAVGIMAFGGGETVLRIAALPSFGRAWLLPKLAPFLKQHSGIRIDLNARLSPVDFSTDSIDMAIMRTSHILPFAETIPIMPEKLVVVAAPFILGDRSDLDDQSLLNLPLLQQSTRPTLWLDWFKSHDTDPRRALRGARMDHFDMVVDAAIAGMGLAIVPDIIARPALDRGDLVLATERQFETGDHYAMIMPVSGMSQTARLFIDWVQTGIAGCPKADGAQ